MFVRTFIVLGLGALAASCAAPGLPSCPSGSQAMVSETLYFGTQKPNGTVSAGDWQAFLNESVTPRFPDGLSVWQAAGQWKSNAGPTVRESSYVLSIVHADTPAARAALGAVASEYKARFTQDAVMRVRMPTCVSF
jgi:hypothetical protein